MSIQRMGSRDAHGGASGVPLGWAKALALVAASAVPAFGAGFELQEGGAKAMGMANAFTGVADDASAAFYNPAALARFKGMGGMLGATLVDVAYRHFTDERDEGMTNQKLTRRPIPIPHGYLAMGFDLTDRLRLGLGGGIHAPFGLAEDWGRGQEWGGRFELTKGSIVVVEPNANVAVEFDVIEDTLSLAVAGGFSLVYGELLLSRRIDFNALIAPGAGESDLKIRMDVGEDNLPIRWNVAGMVRLFDNRLRLGVSYRHQISDVRVSGRAKVHDQPAAVAASGAFGPVPNRTKLKVRLPGNLRVGVGFDVLPELTLSFDWRFSNWSVMDTFFVESELAGLDGNALEFEYRDSDYFALGAEYRVYQFADDGMGLAFRGGLLYDETPIPRKEVTALLPDNDRWGFTVGVGYEPVENLKIDFAYMGLYITHFILRNDSSGASTSGDGKYRGWANLFSLSASYSF